MSAAAGSTQNHVKRLERFQGALFGLAYGDALGFPALFHRTYQFPERRREFLWRTNRDLARQRILRLTLPFTHRIEAGTLEPFPTDDTEYTLFTAQTLLAAGGRPRESDFEDAWRQRMLPLKESILTGFAERAALENLERGLHPPATGSDNPQHYDDSAVPRAVAVGLACAGDPQEAQRLARLDAQVDHDQDGVSAAQAMAVAISLLAEGAALPAALEAARAAIPPDSWLAHGERTAQECLQKAQHAGGGRAGSAQDLLLLLITRLVNTVYSYGNAAPETLPAAFAIAQVCADDFQRGVWLANSIPKSADSLPAMVGALLGAHHGIGILSARWVRQLEQARGLCLPFTRGVSLRQTALELMECATRC